MAGRKVKVEVTSTIDPVATGMASIAQLAQLFETDRLSLPKRLKGLPPVARRGQVKLYNVREVAEKIVSPGYEVEEWIKQASPQEVNPHLLKEFWNGQNARTKFEREMGNLWETHQVVDAFAEVFSTIRMTLLLFADDVDREESLSDNQRQIIRRLTDALIVRVGESIQEKFKHYDRDATDQTADDEDDDWNISAADDDEEDDDGNILAAEADEEENLGI